MGSLDEDLKISEALSRLAIKTFVSIIEIGEGKDFMGNWRQFLCMLSMTALRDSLNLWKEKEGELSEEKIKEAIKSHSALNDDSNVFFQYCAYTRYLENDKEKTLRQAVSNLKTRYPEDEDAVFDFVRHMKKDLEGPAV